MISVIVPLYNAEKYLRDCLNSLANQTLKDIEIILVDDGSTDSSHQICKEYTEKFTNFTLLTKQNGGQQSAWLMGVEYCKGEYIGFVDSDDYVDITMYEKLMNCALDTNADIVMCGRRITTQISGYDDIPNLELFYGQEEMGVIYKRILPSLKGGNISSARWDKIYKREIFLPNTKYCVDKSRYCEDRFIVPACLFSARTFAVVPEALYFYRIVDMSSSRKPKKEVYYILENLYRRQTEMLLDKGIYEEYYDKLNIAKLDYIRIVVLRNLCSHMPMRDRIEMAKLLLENKVNRECVLMNKEECVNKFGKYIYACFKINSPIVMVLGATFFRVIRDSKNKTKYEAQFLESEVLK